MNSEKSLLDEWLEALESEEYIQGRERLCTINADGTCKYCCLGVLCELAVKRGIIPQGEKTISAGQWVMAYDGNIERLPRDVEDALGYWAKLPVSLRREGNHGQNLITLNDTLRMNFKEIASAIRHYGLVPLR